MSTADISSGQEARELIQQSGLGDTLGKLKLTPLFLPEAARIQADIDQTLHRKTDGEWQRKEIVTIARMKIAELGKTAVGVDAELTTLPLVSEIRSLIAEAEQRGISVPLPVQKNITPQAVAELAPLVAVQALSPVVTPQPARVQEIEDWYKQQYDLNVVAQAVTDPNQGALVAVYLTDDFNAGWTERRPGNQHAVGS
ncbi:MAG: hypothetical protein HQL18_04840 [Candidatus Omnitrophica bacterium]|nr:hypothetical protein [Candidatus Omnitrophota bacterium]